MKNKNIFTLFAFVSLTLVIYSCKKDPEPVNKVFPFDIGALPPPNIPVDNALTPEKVQLGRMLFYDTRLSRTNTQSCASCHVQANAFSDTNRFSVGITGAVGKRQSMAIFNTAWHTGGFFWDGRSDLLRHQSLLPIEDPTEMDDEIDNVISKLNSDSRYADQFFKAYGSSEITSEKMGLAMEQFMNSIVSKNAPFDQFLAGTREQSPSEARGMQLFFREFNPFFPDSSGADCTHCHGGLTMENDLFMNNGLEDDAGVKDIGREEVTGNPMDRAKFKVPSLRNIELTAPYMHDGRFKTLEEVVNHYNTGVKQSATLDPAIMPTVGGLNLTQQDVDDLVAFLKTLTDEELITNPAYSDPFQ